MRAAEQLKHDVEQELRWEPSVKAEEIGVSVRNGVVELDGHVESLYEKWGAEQAALRVANVKSIASEITVDLNLASERSDTDIAHAATNNLNWNYSVPATVKVTVADGWVTLSGETEWQYQREEAARVIRSLHGVKGISNDIQLKPTVSAAGVKDKIEDALKRASQIDATRISVEAAGNIVTLRGSVPSWRESREAECAAFSAPGVASVSNLLEIGY